MMEHVQAGNGKVQHLADVPTKAWRRSDGMQWTEGPVLTVCGQSIGPVVRMLENPRDCTRCRKAVSKPAKS